MLEAGQDPPCGKYRAQWNDDYHHAWHVLLTREGLAKVHQSLVGLGYLPVHAGSKNLRDAQTGVRIDFLVAGDFPGDGKPKPVA